MSEVKKPPISVYRKLLNIQKEVVGLGKDSSGFGFKYVSGNKILNHIKPIMNKEGLLLLTQVVGTETKREDYNVLKKHWVDNGQGQKVQKEVPTPKTEVFIKCNILFTWVCVDTGEELSLNWDGIGFNDWDKGLGSAVTYSERYFLLKNFHISTDEDDIDNPESNENKRLMNIEQRILTTFNLDALNNIYTEISDKDKLLFKAVFSNQKDFIIKQQQGQQQGFNQNNNNNYNNGNYGNN